MSKPWTPPKVKARPRFFHPAMIGYRAKKRKWKQIREERLMNAWIAYRGLKLRVRFDILEKDDNGNNVYHPLSGTTILFEKIPTPGKLLGIVSRISEAGLKEVREMLEARGEEKKVSELDENLKAMVTYLEGSMGENKFFVDPKTGRDYTARYFQRGWRPEGWVKKA